MQDNNNYKEITLGYVDFHGSVDITDPMYNKNVWCRMNDIEIAKGEYLCRVWLNTDESKYKGKTIKDTRVAVIGICHEDFLNKELTSDYLGNIGVDSGSAGFFHNKPDDLDCEDVFGGCSRLEEGPSVLISDDDFLRAFFSDSGYGDGGYPVAAFRSAEDNSDEIVALKIYFM